MTYRERTDRALKTHETEMDKLLAYAYYRGKTEAARAVCDEHTRRLAAMRAEADKQRYHGLAHRIIDAGQVVRQDAWTVRGNPDAIYHPDYAGDYADTFGGDEVMP